MNADQQQALSGELAVRLLAAMRAAGAQKSWSLSELAHALDPQEWQSLLPPLRQAIKTLARAGRLVLTRKGKPADPDTIKGVYRIGLPRHD